MTETPRTDRLIDCIAAGIPCETLDVHAKRLEEELRMAEMAAKDNADWFDNLVHDLAEIYGCEKSASAVVRMANEQRAGAAVMREASQRMLSQAYSVGRYSSWVGMCEDNNESDARDDVAAALATGAGREFLEKFKNAQAARNSNADDRDAALNERDALKAELTMLRRKVAAAEVMAELLGHFENRRGMSERNKENVIAALTAWQKAKK